MTLVGLFDGLRNRRRLIVIVVAALILPFILFGAAGIRINCSPSLPLGFYKTTSDPNARLVEFCPPDPWAALASSRGYRSTGTCPDGATPLMKMVVARQGEVVSLSDRGITVNGRLLSNTAPRFADSHGRALQPWTPGQYPVLPGTVWVASTYNQWSFDSRYFGPIPTSLIRHRLKAMLTF
jgi:conjugative transfer signal peptidase TraF